MQAMLSSEQLSGFMNTDTDAFEIESHSLQCESLGPATAFLDHVQQTSGVCPVGGRNVWGLVPDFS